jgi:hypothetical protein
MRGSVILLLVLLPLYARAQTPQPAPQSAPQATAQAACRVLDAGIAERYEGPCQNGLAAGRGKASGPGGSYEGDFVAGRKQGRGVQINAAGDRYEGDFANDQREGQGSLRYGPGSPWNGDTWVGGFKADKLHGDGTYTWAFGDVSKARFENGAQVAGATAYQHMRAVGIQQLATVLKEGSEICRVVYPPASGATPATPIRLRGKFLGAAGDRALIELTDAPGVQPGARTWDIVTRWAPCGSSVRRK